MDEYTKALLKRYIPNPISKKRLMRISGKTALIMLAIMVVSVVLGLIKGDIVVILTIGGIFCLVAFLLEMKDKIKYCTYEVIEERHIYIDKVFYAPGGCSAKVIYYDFKTCSFISGTMYIDRFDYMKYRITPEVVENMLVGFRKSKIYYISTKELFKIKKRRR